MKKSHYKDSYGDGYIEAVARVMCGGDSGALLQLYCLHACDQENLPKVCKLCMSNLKLLP